MGGALRCERPLLLKRPLLQRLDLPRELCLRALKRGGDVICSPSERSFFTTLVAFLMSDLSFRFDVSNAARESRTASGACVAQ